MIYATCRMIMFILSQMTITFYNFPVNIWVTSLIVKAFHGSTFLQSGILGSLDLHRYTGNTVEPNIVKSGFCSTQFTVAFAGT